MVEETNDEEPEEADNESDDEAPEKTDNESDDEELEETNTEGVWLQSQGTVPSFAFDTTETTASSPVDDGDLSESGPRVDKLIAGPTYMPTKRSSSQYHRRRGKRRLAS